jgi:hypothetical protein
MTLFKPPRWWDQQQRYVYDNKTHRVMDFERWEDFVDLLQQLSKRRLRTKQQAELISPAVFEQDSPRRNKHVLNWARWAAIDVDDCDVDGDVESFCRNLFGDVDYVIYSTASSTKQQPKFRVVLRLSRDVYNKEIKHFWFALNTHIGGVNDRQTKDLARMYYTPATYDGANNFFFTNSGESVNVDKLLTTYPHVVDKKTTNFLERLPEQWQQQIISQRQSLMDNSNITWKDYRDCPFVNRKLVDQYKSISTIDGSGRYRMIYKIMCSIAAEAVSNKYPITSSELVYLIKQLDNDTSRRYENRPLDIEADNAIQYAYQNYFSC